MRDVEKEGWERATFLQEEYINMSMRVGYVYETEMLGPSELGQHLSASLLLHPCKQRRTDIVCVSMLAKEFEDGLETASRRKICIRAGQNLSPAPYLGELTLPHRIVRDRGEEGVEPPRTASGCSGTGEPRAGVSPMSEVPAAVEPKIRPGDGEREVPSYHDWPLYRPP
jgi:hypothetical protein